MPACSPADFVYVGYPKAASTYVEHYLARYDNVSIDRLTQRPLHGPSIEMVETGLRPSDSGRIHISINEKVAESVIYTGDHSLWRKQMFTPGAWDAVRPHIRIDPAEVAARIKKAYPFAKVLIIIREQVDWLHSAYRYFMPRLPAAARSFDDFCATPRGIVYLKAGHYDVTIAAYAEAFGAASVKVLRFEDIGRAPDKFAAALTQFVGIEARPLPREKSNEGNTVAAASIRMRFPSVDALPAGLRRFGGNLIGLLPGERKSLISAGEAEVLKASYMPSNQRTESLIARLGA